MTIVLGPQVGEAHGAAQARIARELMLSARKRWCNAPLSDRLIVKLSARQRGRAVDVQHRRRALSCGRRVHLRAWHEVHWLP